MAEAVPNRPTVAREAFQKLSGLPLASSVLLGGRGDEANRSLLKSPALSAALPGGGFPQGGVVELASPANLGRSVTVALSACAEAQRAGLETRQDAPWCAFLDPDATLFAPAIRASGVKLDKLLVLRPPRQLLGRVAVRIALSRIFSVVVVDVAGVLGSSISAQKRSESMDQWAKITRRLALAVEKTKTTVFLLTSLEAARPVSLPSAMRIDLENEGEGSLLVRIAKERSGLVSGPRRIVWTRPSPSFAAENRGPLRASGSR